jgi:putative ABC transport system substrate-binding protein
VLLGLDEKDAEVQGRLKAFRLGMRDLGWIEGRNIQIEYRFAGGNLESINKYVAEVIGLTPDVIVANSTPVIAALQASKTTTPIVFAMVNDPVGQGFLPSLAHPGGNISGFTFLDFAIIGKWVDLLNDVKPDLSRVTLMFNPDTSPYFDAYLRSFKALPKQTSVEVQAAHIRSAAEADLVLAELGCGLIAGSDIFVVGLRKSIMKSAEQHRVPVISAYRQFVVEGSLMSYGPDTALC